MFVLRAPPPNLAKIVAVLPQAGEPGVLFCYGRTIYNPDGAEMTRALRAHERVHSEQQEALGGPEAWWDRYLADPQFRIVQEIPAHRAEFREFCRCHANRNRRHDYLRWVVEKLTSPLYGGLITQEAALAAVCAGQAKEA